MSICIDETKYRCILMVEYMHIQYYHSEVSKIFFIKRMAIKIFMVMLQKISVSNKRCSFEPSIKHITLKKNQFKQIY